MEGTELANDRQEMDLDAAPAPAPAADQTEAPAAIAGPAAPTEEPAPPPPTTAEEPAEEPQPTDTETEPKAPDDAAAQRPLGPDGKPISKSAHKKMLKLQRLADTREQWKADKKRKLKERKQRDREEREAAGTTNKRKNPDGDEEEEGEGTEEGAEEHAGKKQKQQKPAAAEVKRVVEDITLILDCGFDDKMYDKEIVSLSSQLTRCYAFNRAAPRQFHLSITSLTGRLLTRFQTGLGNNHLHWKGITFSEHDYAVTDESRDKLVYLTADSEHTIEDLVPGTSYIIGGIVDRNRYKGLCYNKALAQGIRTAKLPIGDYIKMASRFVLTTNQVVEIMLKYLECRDWKEAFIAVIPPRKQPAVKTAEAASEGAVAAEEGAEEEEEEKTS